MLSALALLHLSFLIFIFFIVRFREYKKSLFIYFIIIFTIFYTPVIYYTVLDGQAYRIFTEKDLQKYIYIASAVFIQLSIFIVLKNSFSFKPIKMRLHFIDKVNTFVNVYVGLIVSLVLIYLVLFFPQLPLYQTLMSGTVVERPDIVGNLPGYFTFSIFSSLIVPGFYFYYLKLINKHKIIKIILIILISLLMVAGGNKGMLVYYYIFIWIFEFKLKINFKVIFMVLSSFVIYLFLKTGELRFTQENWDYITTSPFRRFFVTQGVGFIARIHLLGENVDFTTIDSIKNYVFYVIYGSNGSHPTYFLADIIIKYGIYLGFLVHTAVISILFYISRFIDKQYRSNLFILWNFVVICFLIGMAELSTSFLLRTFVILINIIALSILAKIKKKNNYFK